VMMYHLLLSCGKMLLKIAAKIQQVLDILPSPSTHSDGK
jgi:hypothetical protein